MINKIDIWKWLSSIFLCLLFSSGALANTFGLSPVIAEFDVNKDHAGKALIGDLYWTDSYISNPPTDIAIGAQGLIPLRIVKAPNWKSADLRFQVIVDRGAPDNPNAVQVEPISFTQEEQVPLIEHIPLRVTEEGLFTVHASLHIVLNEEAALQHGQETLDFELPSMVIFAFEGKVYLGSSFNQAVGAKASENLESDNKRFAALQMQRSMLTDQEIIERNKIMEAERNHIYQLYLNKFPRLSQQSSIKALPANLKAGDSVVISVNWPAKSYANPTVASDYQPLHGAEIEFKDSDNGSLITGRLNEGKYTLIVPRDDYKFTASIRAKYALGSNLYFKMRTDGEAENPTNPNLGIVTATFSNQDVFNIPNASSATEVNDGFAAFQGFVRLIELSSQSNVLNFSKAQGFTVLYGLSNSESFYCHNPAPGGLCSCPSSASCTTIKDGNFQIAKKSPYYWDVLGHEFGHAIAAETNAVNGIGSYHTGNNQYDVSNPLSTTPLATFHNKDLSTAMALNEGYGTWIGVALTERLSTPGVGAGDQTYTSTGFKHDLKNVLTQSYFGEDAEFAIAGLLWYLIDTKSANNVNAPCKDDACNDAVSIPLVDLYNGVFANNFLRNIGKFYEFGFQQYTGQTNVYFDIGAGAPVVADVVDQTHQLGSVFAEFGIAPYLDDRDDGINKDAFKDFSATAPTLKWQHLKTGTMPGHDQFDILFFNKDKNKLLYKLAGKAVTPGGNTYSYAFTADEHKAFALALFSQDGNASSNLDFYVLIKGTASGATAATPGNIATGPYFSNLGEFQVNGTKLSVIAVDSSGSNIDTDPANHRVDAAHALLNKMVQKNQAILDGKGAEGDWLRMAAALDFDSSVLVLSNFAWPEILHNKKIFSQINSWGGTDIAAAIYKGVNMIKKYNDQENLLNLLYKNRSEIFLLTDADNNSGWVPVIAAMGQAAYNGITEVVPKIRTGR